MFVIGTPKCFQISLEDDDIEVGVFNVQPMLVGSEWKIYRFEYEPKDCDAKFQGNTFACQVIEES